MALGRAEAAKHAKYSYPRGDLSKKIVSEEAQYKINHLIDGAVVIQFDGNFWLVMHSRLCVSGKESPVRYHSDNISIHVASS